MNHAEIRKLLGTGIAELATDPKDLPLQLRPYQVETLDSVAKWLLNPEGTQRAYVSQATGLGKTVLFASIIRAAFGLRVLVIVPTKTLLVQTARVISRFTGGMLGHISSLPNILNKDHEIIAIRGMSDSAVVLTTDASFNRLAPQIKAEFDPHIILRDECHWGYIDPSIVAMNEFSEAVILGFSATPDYLTNVAKDGYLPVTLENGLTLYGPLDRFADTHFQTCLVRHSLRWGIENGWLAPLAWGLIEFDVDLNGVPVVEGPDGPDYDESQLQQVMRKHWSVMCETVRRLYENGEYDLQNRQAYALCASVDDAEELAEAINSIGIPSTCVSGRTGDAEREIILQSFADNEIRFLTSVMVLREGWNAPNAEVCMMLRPTKSRVLYEQAIGRGTRLPEDGAAKVTLVLDAHFQGRNFAPLSAPALYGKPGEEIRVGDILIGGGGGVRGGEGVESPYLPKDATPRIFVIETYEAEASSKANEQGVLSAEGEDWICKTYVEKTLQVTMRTLTVRIQNGAVLRTRAGRTSGGTRSIFYALEDVKRVLADLLDKPLADAEGCHREKDEVWAPISILALRLDQTSKLLNALVELHPSLSLKPIRCRNGILRDAYKESEIVALLGAIQAKQGVLPPAPDSAGLEGWTLLSQAMKRFDLPRAVIEESAQEGKVRTKKGRGYNKKNSVYYAAADIPAACTDYIAAVRLGSNEEGEVENARWCSAKALARRYKVSENLVRRYCGRAQSVVPRLGRLGNRFIPVFPLEGFDALLTEGIKTDNPSDPEWVILKDAPAVLDLNHVTVAKKLKERATEVRTRPGKTVQGKPAILYFVEDLRKICADLLLRPRIGDDGAVEKDGSRWMLQKYLAEELGVLDGKILFHIHRNKDRIRQLEVRDRHGTPQIAYHHDDVAALFSELRQNQVDEQGILNADGEVWGLMKVCMKRAGLKPDSFRLLLAGDAPIRTRDGYGQNGSLLKLYALSDIDKIMAGIRAQRR